MGITKTDQYLKKHNDLAVLLKAIAHPARITIIEYLLKNTSCICNDIVEELPLAQATISQHLKELKNAGIIKGNIEGNSICYCLDMDVMQKINQYFSIAVAKIKTQNEQCC